MELSSITNALYNTCAYLASGTKNVASEAWSSVSSREALASTVTSIAQAIISKNGQLTMCGAGAAYALKKAVAQYNAFYNANSSPEIPKQPAKWSEKIEYKASFTNENGEVEPEIEAKEPELLSDEVEGTAAVVATRLDCVKAATKPLIAATLLTIATIARAII